MNTFHHTKRLGTTSKSNNVKLPLHIILSLSFPLWLLSVVGGVIMACSQKATRSPTTQSCFLVKYEGTCTVVSPGVPSIFIHCEGSAQI